MRFLVTGASGHVGSHLVKLLINHGHKVIAVVRPTSDLKKLNEVMEVLTLIKCDLSDDVLLKQKLSVHQVDCVVHLAWNGITEDIRNNPLHMMDNINASINLCQLSSSLGCKTWVGVGSQAEYGLYNGILKEDISANPLTAYGIAKNCVRVLSRKICEELKMRYIWVRLFATYGPYDDPRHLIPSVINQLLCGEQPKLTAGAQKWDYLHVADAAEALYATVMSSIDGVYNLASGKTDTVRSIVTKIRDLIDPKIELTFGQLPYQISQIMHLQGDITKLTQATSWQPNISLEKGLAETILWHQQQKLSL